MLSMSVLKFNASPPILDALTISTQEERQMDMDTHTRNKVEVTEGRKEETQEEGWPLVVQYILRDVSTSAAL